MLKDRERRGQPLRARRATACALLLLAGCHIPPAPIAPCTPDQPQRSRQVVLACEIARDSLVEVVHHPLRCACGLFVEPAEWLGAAGRGLLGKRLFLRCASPCGKTPTDQAPAERVTEAEPCAKPAALQLFPDGHEALAALEHTIAAATCRLDVLMFDWDPTPLGMDIAARLAARAGPQLRVRVLVDGGGNLLFPVPRGAPPAVANRAVCWLAQQPHVEVLRTRIPFAHFDHRKLVLADGCLAWAGGRNFTHDGFFGRHDVSYTLCGPLAGDLQALFERFWQDQGGKPAEPLPVPPLPCVSAVARLVGTGPCERSLEHALYAAIDGACHRVWLENPYLADSGLVNKLIRAARRGVDVRVVMAIQGDTEVFSRANRVTANRLREAGVRVFLYPTRLHTKAAAVDGCWAYVGSGNFDSLSLRRNHELGVVITAGPVLAEVDRRIFLPDFCPQWELHEPLPVGPADYAAEMLANLFL